MGDVRRALAGKSLRAETLTAFAEVLAGLTREEKPMYLTISNGRSAGIKLQNTVGMYVRTLPVVFAGKSNDHRNESVADYGKSVCADSFIRTMPGGYDMVLSKGASNISQGQRQLITIARAIIANPEIMILDEATSNLDAHTELVIQEAMATLMKGRTSFVIAHRLSTIRDANVIFYMENGDIMEVGDHDELMAKNGKYALLYNSQFA